MLWADLHLLSWLSLVPFTTAWAGETHFARTPSASYGAVLLIGACCGNGSSRRHPQRRPSRPVRSAHVSARLRSPRKRGDPARRWGAAWRLRYRNRLLSGVAYFVLERALVASEGRHSRLAVAVGVDTKAVLSVVLYAAGIAVAFVRPWIATGIYVAVAGMWLVPDPRIEARLHAEPAARAEGPHHGG